MTIRTSARMLLSLGLGATSLSSAVPKDPLVLVERVIDTRYGATTNADFNQILRSPLRYVYTVKPGDTLQSIAGSLYGVRAAEADSHYSQFAEEIKSLNGLKDVNHLVPGQSLVVPALPPEAPTARILGGPGPGIPKIQSWPSRSDVLSGKGYNYELRAAVKPGEISSLGQKDAALVRQAQWVPASVARDDRSVTVLAQPISVRFQQAAAGQAGDDLSQDITGLKNFAHAHPAVHESVVYVLDDSWPDAQSFSESVQFLRDADAKIRAAFHFGAGSWPATASPTATTTFPWVGTGDTSHAAKIEVALGSFRPISNAVKVVYVPLFTQQPGAADLLGELILMYLIGHDKHADLKNPISADALGTITADAQKKRDQIMQSLPAHLSGQPSDTDEAVIKGLMYFAQWYAQISGEPYFLNTSWVVNQYEFDFGPPAKSLGVTFAAAGDDPSTDIFASNVLLASHASASPGDVIAVMNNHPDGSRGQCTSYWKPNGPLPIYGLTYDGFLANNLCGTSFSAPRIAWTLAFRESLRPLVTNDQAQNAWFQNYQTFIISLQDASRPADLRYWFSPLAALQK